MGRNVRSHGSSIKKHCIAAFMGQYIVAVVALTRTLSLSSLIVETGIPIFTKQEGATKEDIELLPKFTFRRDGGAGKTTDEIQGLCGGVMTEYGTDSPIEHVLSPEDAVRSLSRLHT